MPRRATLESVRPSVTSHPGLWLDAYLDKDPKQVDGEKTRTMQEALACRCPPEYRDHFERWRRSFESASDNALLTTASTDGRLVIGLGNKNVLEVGIRLDHTWGVPVLPGSALKGLASRTAHLDAGPGWNRPDSASAGETGRYQSYLFGTTENAGAIIFHDAWWDPESKVGPLELDVMTVHHKDYYQSGGLPPSDMDSPTPIAFVTTSGTFLIALECRHGVDPSWLRTALDLIEHGLQHHGLGAKTNAGYGRMSLAAQPATIDVGPDWLAKVEASKAGEVAGLVPLIEKLPPALRKQIAQAVIAKHKDLMKAKAGKGYVETLKAMAAGTVP